MVSEYLAGALARQTHHGETGHDPRDYDEQVTEAMAVLRNAAVQRGASPEHAERHAALVRAAIERRQAER
ncbi:MAG: hypothetical protein GXX79_21840 [Actinomycetales bacterium]|nr:hypothetical protein [Actinomycetales bacterium]